MWQKLHVGDLSSLKDEKAALIKQRVEEGVKKQLAGSGFGLVWRSVQDSFMPLMLD